MKFINLTPHPVTIYKMDRTMIRIEPTGMARCNEYNTDDCIIDGLRIRKTTYGEVEGLPDPAPDTAYIVSLLTAQHVKGRTDIFYPGSAIRDSEGHIIACEGLNRIGE